MKYIKHINETSEHRKVGNIRLMQQQIGSNYILDFENIGQIDFEMNKVLAEEVFEFVIKLKSLKKTDKDIFNKIKEYIRFFNIWLE
jgi:hypothetical protein